MMTKKSKIVATIGPASRNKDILLKLAEAGANVFRLNFSHGSHNDHALVISWVREINEETNHNLCLLQDLQGPKIRIGLMKDGGAEIKEGQKLVISVDNFEGNSERVSTSYKRLVNDVKVGDAILIDDGNIEVKVISATGRDVVTQVIHGGYLKSKKGINFPMSNISAASLTDKDKEDLKFGLEQDVDWIALSFVRSAEDIIDLKEKITKAGKSIKVVAKIEKPEALDNIDAIIASTDAIMIARGDLGVEIPLQKVPIWQKKIIEKCNIAAKPVIVATQMMESMIQNPRPTRAEANDVANAVMDGADALMLSAESASGDFPIEAVSKMTSIISSVEKEAESIYHKFYTKTKTGETINNLLIRAACRLAEFSNAAAIITMTKSGYSGFRTAMHRSKSNLYLLTNNKKLVTQMNLVWGVKTFYYDKEENIDQTMLQIEKKIIDAGILKKGDIFINTASMPQHWQGHTNMMKVNVVE